jgi:hypothetical protein
MPGADVVRLEDVVMSMTSLGTHVHKPSTIIKPMSG